jgi:hypothetical protein
MGRMPSCESPDRGGALALSSLGGAEHFCAWLTGYRARIGVAPSAEAFLIVANAQLHHAASSLHAFAATCRCCLGEAFQGPLLHSSALAD